MNKHLASVASAVYAALAISITMMLSSCQSTPSSTSAEASPPQESRSSPGSPSASAAPAPQQPAADPAGGQTRPEAGRTTQEVIGDLDGELDTSIAVFDGMILDERAKAEAIAEASGADGAAASEGSEEALFEEGDLHEGLPGYGEFPDTTTADGEDGDGDGDGSENASDTGVSDTSGDASGQAPAGPPGTGARAPGSSAAGAAPADVGNGNDDDIVARQIREAALKEKDPVLRDKLWNEYRKYKNQQRVP